MTPMSPQPAAATNPTNMVSPQQIPVVDQQAMFSNRLVGPGRLGTDQAINRD